MTRQIDMSAVSMKEIETVQELRDVLEMCYGILGTENDELYGYDAWHKRLKDGLQPLVFAMKDGKLQSDISGSRSEYFSEGIVK